MFRKDLIDVLLDNPKSVTQIAREFGESPGQITGDLKHLFRSLKHTEYKELIEPSRCRECGFEFSEDKLTKPSKCPKCRGTWLTEPRISILPKNRQ
jgi:predicted Zn-ribbon and HTH transcriptional regulator